MKMLKQEIVPTGNGAKHFALRRVGEHHQGSDACHESTVVALTSRSPDRLEPEAKPEGQGIEAAAAPDGLSGVAIKVQGLGKQYGALQVLKGMDLEIAPGEFVAIVGRSGCGKSTLLRLLSGLEQPNQGDLLIDGENHGGLRNDTRVMFQEARLLPWKSVLNNVGLGLSGKWQPKALEVLAQVGLAERAGDWPAILSGGQRQRVSLAKALIHTPRLLLLDEPLGALDALTRIEMQDLIERLWQQYRFTALLVTHDVAEAVAMADRVVLIESGQITLDKRIALPRPRRRGSPELAALEGEVLQQVLGKRPCGRDD